MLSRLVAPVARFVQAAPFATRVFTAFKCYKPTMALNLRPVPPRLERKGTPLPTKNARTDLALTLCFARACEQITTWSYHVPAVLPSN